MINEHCIKCGYDKAFFEYYGHDSYVEELDTLSDRDIRTVTKLSPNEVIEITCGKCSYVWFSKPLDVQNRGEINV